jgi:hypothetical protein
MPRSPPPPPPLLPGDLILLQPHLLGPPLCSKLLRLLQARFQYMSTLKRTTVPSSAALAHWLCWIIMMAAVSVRLVALRELGSPKRSVPPNAIPATASPLLRVRRTLKLGLRDLLLQLPSLRHRFGHRNSPPMGHGASLSLGLCPLRRSAHHTGG